MQVWAPYGYEEASSWSSRDERRIIKGIYVLTGDLVMHIFYWGSVNHVFQSGFKISAGFHRKLAIFISIGDLR